MKLHWVAGLLVIAAVSGTARADESCDCPKDTAPAVPVDWHLRGYLGGNAGENHFAEWSVSKYNDGSYGPASEDNSAMGFRAFGGLEFLKHFAVELAYADLGKASFSVQSDGSGTLWSAGPVNQEVRMRGVELALLGRLGMTQDFSAVAQLGTMFMRGTQSFHATVQGQGPINRDSTDHGTNLRYGGGLEYSHFRPWRLDATVTTMPFDSLFGRNGRITTAGLSLAYVFSGAPESRP